MFWQAKKKVKVDTSAAISKGTLLKWDATNHYYVVDDGTSPEAVLLEDVAAGQNPPYALALIGGFVFSDEISTSLTEDLEALLAKHGIYVVERSEVNAG